MQTFNFNLKVQISDNWVEDGWDSNLIQEKIKQYVEERMNPYCYAMVEFKCDISEKKSKSKLNNNESKRQNLHSK